MIRGNVIEAPSRSETISRRVNQIDFAAIHSQLNYIGWCTLPSLLSPDECASAIGLYDKDCLYRSKVVMARHSFGRGEYRYFNYPLPGIVSRLRTHLFPPLADIANQWNEILKRPTRFPPVHKDYLQLCAAEGQTRPTPLILRYEKEDYNCLHQDLYGEMVFPLQVAILLSKPGDDFGGGEFVLTEQRPRMQSRPNVAHLSQGDAIVFAVSEVPKMGKRGPYRVKMRHGVSRIHFGERFALGIIFHDAK